MTKLTLTALLSLALVALPSVANPTSPSPTSDSIDKTVVDKAAAAPLPASSSGDIECLTELDAIKDLKQRRDSLETRERALQAIEEELKQREAALQEELKKIEQIRIQISGTEVEQKKSAETKIAKLVETIELMSPKTAAKMMSELEDRLAVSTMEKIATPKLAKIMANMDASRSSELAELLTSGKKKSKKVITPAPHMGGPG